MTKASNMKNRDQGKRDLKNELGKKNTKKKETEENFKSPPIDLRIKCLHP